jgi:DNA-binding CsgD family transcriptional regulator
VDTVEGREVELATLARFLDVPPRPTALVVEGEAGIGKTTVWQAGVALARARGDRVLACRPAAAEAKLPLAALGDLLADVIDEALPSVPVPQARALEAALLRADAEGPAPEPRAVPRATLAILRHVAGRSPVMLAIDDLQWLDLASARTLAFALRRLVDEPVRVLATVRTEARRRVALDLERVLPDAAVEVVLLRGLDQGSVERMLLARMARVVPRPVARRVHAASGGNPLFALEISRAFDRLGASALSSLRITVPETLRELVRDRLAALPHDAQEVVFAASGLSHPTVSTVLSVVGSSPALATAVEAGILEVSHDRIVFTHPLLAAAAYEDAPLERRRALHTALAAAVSDPVERARHLAFAVDGADAAIAGVLEDAARDARARGAPDDAAELCARAIRLTPAVGGADARRRTALAAAFSFEAGDTVTACRLRESVVAAAPAGPERAVALTHLGSMWLFRGDFSAAEAALGGARAHAHGDYAILAAAEESLAWAAHFRGDGDSAAAHARAGLRLAERVGEPLALIRALKATAYFDGRRGRRGMLKLIERASALEPASDYLRATEQPGWVHAALLAGRGDLDAARDRLLPLYERARERGDDGSISILLSFLNRVELRAGDWPLAARYADEGYEAGLEAGQAIQQIFLLGDRALIEAHRGQADALQATLNAGRALTAATGFDSLLAGLEAAAGFFELSRDKAAAANDVLAPLTERVNASRIDEQGSFRFLADAVEARLALADVGGASSLTARLAARRRVAQDSAWAVTTTHRCLGLVLAARGQTVSALDELAHAQRCHRRLPEPFEEARTLLAVGRIQRRLKRKAAARASLSRALTVFTELGAPLWRDQARRELERIGGRAPRQGGLTPTESRIADLVAAGRTNREVAAELFLSVNTVQSYLKRIYRELGVRSRTELARRIGGVKEH